LQQPHRGSHIRIRRRRTEHRQQPTQQQRGEKCQDEIDGDREAEGESLADSGRNDDLDEPGGADETKAIERCRHESRQAVPLRGETVVKIVGQGCALQHYRNADRNENGRRHAKNELSHSLSAPKPSALSERIS
jgi:hypothetical protein